MSVIIIIIIIKYPPRQHQLLLGAYDVPGMVSAPLLVPDDFEVGSMIVSLY